MIRLSRTGMVFAVSTLAGLVGCQPTPPTVVPVEGTVYLDDQPLPFAQVDFVPDLEHFGAEFNSTAVTDEAGQFVLKCQHYQQPGAAVAKHRVLVSDHIPDEMRAMSAQGKLAGYLAKLKNRPIPEAYSVVIRTPLTVEVKAGQSVYDLHLTRRP